MNFLSRRPNYRFVKIGVVFVAVLVVSSSAAWAAKNLVSQNPLPLGAPADAEYTLPQNLPSKTGGPYKNVESIKQIAVFAGQSKGEIKPLVKDIILTTHGDLINSQIFSQSYSVANDREVYLAVLEGSFQFNRGRIGVGLIRSKRLNIEIDATNGEVLALGTSESTL